MHLCIHILYHTALLHFVSFACFCAPPSEHSSKKFWKTKMSLFPSNDATVYPDATAPYDDTSISQAELRGEHPRVEARVRSSRSVPHMRMNSKSSSEVTPVPPIPHHMFVENPKMPDSDYYGPIPPNPNPLIHIHPDSERNPERNPENQVEEPSSTFKSHMHDHTHEEPEFQSRVHSQKYPFAEKQRDSMPLNTGSSSANPNINSRRGIQPLHLGKIPIESSQVDWEYKYTRLLIDRLWEHLLAREMNPTIRNLLMQERTALERLVR
jgi:hypothetical protein